MLIFDDCFVNFFKGRTQKAPSTLDSASICSSLSFRAASSSLILSNKRSPSYNTIDTLIPWLKRRILCGSHHGSIWKTQTFIHSIFSVFYNGIQPPSSKPSTQWLIAHSLFQPGVHTVHIHTVKGTHCTHNASSQVHTHPTVHMYSGNLPVLIFEFSLDLKLQNAEILGSMTTWPRTTYNIKV